VIFGMTRLIQIKVIEEIIHCYNDVNWRYIPSSPIYCWFSCVYLFNLSPFSGDVCYIMLKYRLTRMTLAVA
jgi:hypothetical protein